MKLTLGPKGLKASYRGDVDPSSTRFGRYAHTRISTLRMKV